MRCDAHLAVFSIFGAFAWLGESNFVRGTLISSKCEKKNDSEDTWICSGKELHSIPGDLKVESNEMKLYINDAPMEVLRHGSLTPYADRLTELYLNSPFKLHTIQPGIFNNTTKLKMIYICDAKRLHHIDDKVFQIHLPNLISLRIISSGLLTVPYLGKISSVASSMATVDFDRNKIEKISADRLVDLRVSELILTNNEIQSIDRMAFARSKITELDLSGNIKLTNIDKEAFLDVTSITELNLSKTSITELPTEGLNKTKKLFIENTKTLKTFPPLKNLWNLTHANLTYPYHCCALTHRDKHDPENFNRIREEDKEEEVRSKNWCMERETNKTWCQEWVKNQSRLSTNVICYPKPGVFSPCEDIMGNYWLRIMIWIVGVLAIIGNLAVIIVLVLKSSTTVPEFLMCNLAFPDLCMGIYLLMIADVDARSIGIYFNKAIEWQTGLGCKVAGVFTIFSTELSVFTLVVMSSERWYTIANVMYGRRLRFKSALGIMLVGWIYAGSMAALPLFGISSYDKTSLCLPLEQQTGSDTFYLSTMLVFTCISFLVIVFCYGSMYFSVNRSPEYQLTSLAQLDRKIARKMALLISLSFACWAPIAFFGITTLAGLPLIDLTQTKYVLVIFYPLNSVVNPIVYVLLTRQYREAAGVLLARFIGESRVKKLMGKRNSSEKRSTCRTDKTRALPESPLTMSNNINDSSLSAKYAGASPEKKICMKEIDDAAKGKVTASLPVATSPI